MTKSIDTYGIVGRSKGRLPILRPDPKSQNQYALEDYPKPLGDHCLVCGCEPCKCKRKEENNG